MRQLNFVPSANPLRTPARSGLTHALRERWRGLRPPRAACAPVQPLPLQQDLADLDQRVRQCGEW